MDIAQQKTISAEIRNGNMAAFQSLYQAYAEPLYQFLWHRTPDPETAADLVQDSFTKLWEVRANLNPEHSIGAFLYKIARNLAVDTLRKLTREGQKAPVLDQLEALPSDPESFVKRDRVRAAIKALSEQQRQVFCMSRFDGLRYVQIAEILEITPKTVEVHMGRALKKLRTELADLVPYLFFLLQM